MPRLLLLDHSGPSVPALVDSIRETGADFQRIKPEDVNRGSARGFDGVIASGGFLSPATRREDLVRYHELFDRLDLPYLGICLGMKILGDYYGARLRRMTPETGTHTVQFVRDFPLAPGIRECSVYQSHSYELLLPLPAVLENYATGQSPVEAVKVRGEERFAVQFHPELSGVPAKEIITNFVSRC